MTNASTIKLDHYQCKSGPSYEKTSYNDDANKIIKEVMQVNVTKHLNFLINLAMVTMNTNQVPEESDFFNEAWNHPDAVSQEKMA